MNYLKFFSIVIIAAIFSCSTSNDPVRETKGLLTAKKWNFYSINGGEAYDCVKQTSLTFLENNSLEIDTYIRTPIYTCDGPVRTTYTYTILDNGSKIEWGNNVYTIKKLNHTEFIKSLKTDDKEDVWVYEYLE